MNKENIINEAGEYITIEHRQAIEGLLELYNQEKEKNKELVKVIKNVREMHDVKCKVIDMLIEDIVEYHIPADFCMQYGKYKQNCKTLDDNQMCKKCIRDYYFKKARGGE